MVDVGVGKVTLGAAKPPSRRDGGIGPTGLPVGIKGELTVPFATPRPSVILRSAGLGVFGSPRVRLN